MLPSIIERDLAKSVAAKVHSGDMRGAAQEVYDFGKVDIDVPDDDPKNCNPALTGYLHQLLNAGGMEEAAQLLWTETQFNPNPKSTRDIWNLFDSTSQGLLMGSASMSKSYSMGVRLFLEWVRDPQYTSIRLLGPSEDHLEANLFSHMVGLHQKASLPMPGEPGALFIGLDRRNQYSAIKGLIIPIGKKKKAGRLQGTKCVPRENPHPIFGPMSRLFIFVDEIENVPGGLWSDIDNILSNIDESGAGGLKLFGAYNPTNQGDEVSKRAEPVFGWEDFQVETHYRWKSKRGWDVLRLDGERSENVVEGRTIYPGLQTRAGLEAIAKNSGGRSSAGYYSMGRGAYPPSGVELTVFPPGLIPRMRGEFIWVGTPQRCAGADLALDGGADAVITIGKCGKASGITYPPSLDYPQGRKVMFKNSSGAVTPRFVMQAELQTALPKGDTIKMKDAIIAVCKRAGVAANFLCVDKTGHGRGVSDLIKHEFGHIIDVNYSESPSVGKLMIEDSLTCAEAYDRIFTELWFAAKILAEYGYLAISPSIDMTDLAPELTQRKFRGGKKSCVESKKDFMSRGFDSPDWADSFTLFAHAARKGSGESFSMVGDASGTDDEDDQWYDGGGVRIDFTNRSESLDGHDAIRDFFPG